MGIGQGQQPVEVVAAVGRRSRGEPHVRRQKRHRQPTAYRVGQPLGLLAIHQNPLAPAGGEVRGGDRGRRTVAHFGLDAKPGLVEAQHLLIGGTAQRPEQHRVVNRFEQVGLALGIGAQDRDPAWRRLALEVRQVAEPPGDQTAQPHYSIWSCRPAVRP
jgi:hypothetical protein